jgi:hypothetical protein
VIGSPDGPGTSKRKAIILDDADDKENIRKAIGSLDKKKAKGPQPSAETARKLEELQVCGVMLETSNDSSLTCDFCRRSSKRSRRLRNLR